MNNNINETARKIARMGSANLRELETALMENGIVGTLYKTNTDSIFEEDKKCTLFLRKSGNLKLRLMKVINEEFGLGLREAKYFVNSAPCVLKENMDNDRAEEIAMAIRKETDAKIEIHYHE